MNITRQNYEEWLLLYVDNELSLAERIIVDDFLAANPDLQQELEMLQQSTFQPDEEIVFQHKASLLRSDNGLTLTEDNCEQYFVLYADDELTNQQKASVEEFVYHNPRFQAAFELIQMAKLSPDQSIVFPDKKLLYRKENDRRVVAMRWYRIAAAAVLVLLIGGVSYRLLTKKEESAGIAGKKEQQKETNSGIARNDSANEAPVVKAPLKEDLAEDTHPENAEKKNDVRILPGSIKPDKNDMASKKAKVGSAPQLAPITVPSPISPLDNRANTAVPDRESFVNNDAPKKITPNSNTSIPLIVTQSEATSKGAEQPKSEQLNYPGKAILNNSDLAAIAVPSYDLQSDDEVEIQPAGKKNKMRGILRRVSRVFEKATNAEGDDNRNIRIANFEIAVK